MLVFACPYQTAKNFISLIYMGITRRVCFLFPGGVIPAFVEFKAGHQDYDLL